MSRVLHSDGKSWTVKQNFDMLPSFRMGRAVGHSPDLARNGFVISPSSSACFSSGCNLVPIDIHRLGVDSAASCRRLQICPGNMAPLYVIYQESHVGGTYEICPPICRTGDRISFWFSEFWRGPSRLSKRPVNNLYLRLICCLFASVVTKCGWCSR